MPRPLNRRRFISQSAVGGAAAGLVISAKSAASEAPSDKLVVAVMGLSRGSSLARTFAQQPGVNLKYVCDVDTQRLAGCAKGLEEDIGEAPQTATDFRRILDDKSVDVFVCAAPNHWHGPATILACQAGKHVYVEKPCSHNPREGELMAVAAARHSRAVQVGTQRRSSPVWQTAIRTLNEGAIGRVYLVRGWYNDARGPIGTGQVAEVPAHIDYDLWQGPAPRRPYVDNLVHYKWHWRWHWGNGELGNNGVHALDFIRWGLDVDFPVRVTSSGGRYRWVDDQETPDTHTVCFEFADRRQITWEGLSCNRHGGGFAGFYGDNGTLMVNSSGAVTVFDRADKKVVEHPAGSRGDVEHVTNLLDAIRNDTPTALNSGIADAYKSTLLSQLGNIAQRTGRTLNCDPTNGHVLDDPEAMQLWSREYEPGWEPTV